jgi:hypothetical protein
MHTRIYTYTCTPAYIHTHAHPYIHIHMHTRIYTYTCTPVYTHTHVHPHIHTHKNTRTREIYENKPLPPQAPCNATRPTNPPPPPKALRLSTRRTNSNPHSPHQQISLLPIVLSPPNRSTAPLPSLSHSFTKLRFSLAPMHSQAHPRSLSHPFSN